MCVFVFVYVCVCIHKQINIDRQIDKYIDPLIYISIIYICVTFVLSVHLSNHPGIPHSCWVVYSVSEFPG